MALRISYIRLFSTRFIALDAICVVLVYGSASAYVLYVLYRPHNWIFHVRPEAEASKTNSD